MKRLILLLLVFILAGCANTKSERYCPRWLGGCASVSVPGGTP
jgi:hypothetical protein